MTRQQYEREKILRIQREAEAGRQRELRLIAQGRRDADPRYIRSAVGFWLERQAPPEMRGRF